LNEEQGADAADEVVFPGFREMARGRRALVRQLASRREELGLSQTVVAARMGTSQSAVARLEGGDADVRLSTLERYAAALGQELRYGLQNAIPERTESVGAQE
jgi:transcriptional regulator with XRE-family HTH domain